MKPSFFAVFFLLRLLDVVVRVHSVCECDNIDSVTERFFTPGDNTPLDQDCLNVLTEPSLQSVHDSAEPSGTAFTRFLITKDNCDDPNEDFTCELTNIHGSQEDTLHVETGFHLFVNIDHISGDCYSPQTYHYHKLTCPGFWMVNLCVPNTMDLPASNGKCIDEIRIGQSSQDVLCGKAEPDKCLVGLQGGSLKPIGQDEHQGFGDLVITSAKSQCCGGCGYRFSATCLNEGELGSKKRSTSKAYIKQTMRKHFPPIPNYGPYEVKNILVPNGASVSYIGMTITVFNCDGVLRRFHDIKVFQVYDVLTGFSIFYPNDNVTFTGYGYLMVSYGKAQYMYERVPPFLRLSKQDQEDIQDFVPLIHEGLSKQTNQPNNTIEVITSDDDDKKDYGTKHGKKPGKRSRDRRNVGLADLDGQCDPMCVGEGTSPESSCVGGTAGNQGRKRRHTWHYGHYGYVDPELKRSFYRAQEILRDPYVNPFVERYANAFIFFFKQLYHEPIKHDGHPKYYEPPKYYGPPKHYGHRKYYGWHK